MPPPYSCVQCQFTVPQPICPSCNRFLTEDVAVAEAAMKPLGVDLPTKIEWCTAFGHWGDVFMCCGVMLGYMKRTGQKKVNVLYVGPDIDIVAWLEAQPFVGRVLGMKMTDDEGKYSKFWQATLTPGTVPEMWLGVLYESYRGLPKPEQFVQTHVNHFWFETRLGLPAQVWNDGTIPEDHRQKAGMLLHDRLNRKPPKLYHLHPNSTASELANNHWPHWLAAIEWLIEKTPHTYVLTGLNHIPFLPQSPRLVNLIGKTKSNMEVLAISGFCDGVISTPNSVAHWSVIAKQKCLCVGNKATQFLSSYYRRFLQRGERLTYLNVDTPFSGFQGAACEWLESSAE